MEAVQTSETLVKFYQSTRRYNPEDGHLHPNTLSLNSILILSSHLHTELPSDIFLSGFPTDVLCAFVISHVFYLPTFPAFDLDHL
jgi:hypothetical protein